MTSEFPEGFLWGAATSSYQIEGAASDDGRGPSIWDVFCRRPGKIYAGHTGDVACDHYHRFPEDVALLRAMGLKAYRFSVSWSRVQPDGRGPANPHGLDFYRRLVDALLEAGIRPVVTLFHWDYPLALHRQGGWQNRDSAGWFADYAHLMGEALRDRVSHWITLNEPQVIVDSGYDRGRFAPGETQDRPSLLLGAHHLLLAHGRAVQAIRAAVGSSCQVGWAPVCITLAPATDHPEDVEAARAGMFAVDMHGGEGTFWNNTWWMDPVFRGCYPEDGLAAFGADVPKLPATDLETIAQPIDFVGANIYHTERVRRGTDGRAERIRFPEGHPQTMMNWMVTPEALYWGPRFLYERYRTPILITENGLSCHDWVSSDGKVHDPARIDFTQRYLVELRRAIRDGARVDGYFHWSAMDNFEWGHGYSQRFGLVFVDYATQARTMKDSAYWYRDVIASNGGSLPET